MADDIIQQPTGLCACGCGRKTPISKYTSKRDETVKGQPTKWIRGHFAKAYPPNVIPIEERFWKHVQKADDPEGCWEWTGRRSTDGYGQVQIKGKPEASHRVSYQMAKGHIPRGHVVRHKCDNPPCVNPNHLITGTQKQNINDAKARGRLRNQSHLTDADVAEMRRLREQERVPIDKLARQFRVTYSAVWRLVNYRYRLAS